MIEAFAHHQRTRGFSAQTVRRRTNTLHSFERFLAPANLGDATLAHIEEWLSTKPAARTRHAYRSDLRVFYAWAVKRNLLDTNPAALTDSIKVPKALPRPIGSEVHTALLVGSQRARRMVALELFAGLRSSEVAVLDCSDIGHGVIVVRDGKGGKDRVIPMHPVLAEMLDGIPGSGRLFTRAGRPISSSAVARVIAHQFERCGISATPHQLRHTFGTELARATNGNLVAMADLMGHSSTETTRGYTGWAANMSETIASMYDGGDAA